MATLHRGMAGSKKRIMQSTGDGHMPQARSEFPAMAYYREQLAHFTPAGFFL